MSDKGELDLTGAKQNTGMWLVKVPKYLSQQWSKASGRGEVGKLRIVKNQGRTEVSFTLNEELASISDIGGKPASVSAPREHPFLLQSVGGQTLTVFTETSVENQSEEKSESGSTDKLALEGIVVQRAECRPAASENYMKLKRLQIEESSKPVRLSQQLDKAVTTNYKPVANHQYNIEYEKKKKEDGKRARADKQQVLDMLFSAFEKHQYYNIKDLVDITKQPVVCTASLVNTTIFSSYYCVYFTYLEKSLICIIGLRNSSLNMFYKKLKSPSFKFSIVGQCRIPNIVVSVLFLDRDGLNDINGLFFI
uniref:General transcription factor IIF subunit 2 n=1 Tax=Junco hyemalis TaxID=40217 RepID=A0A8C5JPX7_JUNHY